MNRRSFLMGTMALAGDAKLGFPSHVLRGRTIQVGGDQLQLVLQYGSRGLSEEKCEIRQHSFPELRGEAWSIEFCRTVVAPLTVVVFRLSRQKVVKTLTAWINGNELNFQRYIYPLNHNLACAYADLNGTSARGGETTLVVHDNPVTKTWLRAEELIALVEACPQVKGVKLTDHALSKISILRQSGIPVFAGDDVVAFRSLLLGVAGSMIIAPSVFPAAYQEVVRLVHAEDEARALRLFAQQILPFIHLFGPGDEVSVTKAVFKALGIFRSDELRLPLLPCSAQRLKEVMVAYKLGVDATSNAGNV